MGYVVDPRDIGQAFLSREQIPGVLFSHNDYVRVISGKLANSSGSLVAVLRLEPEPLYVLPQNFFS
jgi:hypothetical protein